MTELSESFELPDRWAEYSIRMETNTSDEKKRGTWPEQRERSSRITSTNNPQIIIEKNDSIDARYLLDRPDSRSCSPSSMISDTMSISEIDPSLSHMTQTLRPHSKAIISGFLYKKGVKSKMWKKRWYTLSDYTLFCYKGAKDAQLLRAMPLPSFSVSILTPDDKIKRKYGFKLFKKHIRTSFFSAETEREMNDWIHEISMACNLQSGADTSSIAESMDLSRSVSYNTTKHQRSKTEGGAKLREQDQFTRHGSLMLKNSQDDLCDQNKGITNPRLMNSNDAWKKMDDNRGMSSPLKQMPKYIIGSSPLKGPQSDRNFSSEVRKSASSFELRLLADNNHMDPNLPFTPFKFTENQLNEKSKEELVSMVLMLINELNVSNTEKIKYKKRMEKHKSTLMELKTSMVKIFDKMQNQLYIEQEKYSAAMRQIRQLEKQISNLEASSKLGRDIFKLTPQLASEIEALDEKIGKAQEALSEVKSAAYHGTFKEVITISSNLEAKEQYDIHLSQLRDSIQEFNTKKTTFQIKKEEVITRMKETSTNIKSIYVEKMKIEKQIESLKSLDDDDSPKEGTSQEQYEQELMDIIGNVHQEEQKFDELAEEDQLQMSRILQVERQVKRAQQLERNVVCVDESQKSTLAQRIQRNIGLLRTHLLDIAEERSKHEQEFYMISSRSPNGLFPKLPHPDKTHSDILKELANATKYLEYKSILELGLFSTMLQELLELESENIEKLKSLVVESRNLQTDYKSDVPQKNSIISILNPATSRLARQILSIRNFQAMLLI